MQQFKAKVLSNRKIAPEHHILSFWAPNVARKTKPGQFFSVKVDNSYDPLLRRPFGAHKITRNTVEILYKVVGKATRILSSKKKGDALDVIGPLGNGFEVSNANAILVAGGHGVAPLYALAAQMTKPLVLIGARAKAHLVCEKDFKKLGARVRVATDDGSKGHKGSVADLLTKSKATIYACGPKPMLKAVAKLAERYNMPCQVSLEEYIACGIGTCLGCAINTKSGYKLVCKDGPVFDAKDVIW